MMQLPAATAIASTATAIVCRRRCTPALRWKPLQSMDQTHEGFRRAVFTLRRMLSIGAGACLIAISIGCSPQNAPDRPTAEHETGVCEQASFELGRIAGQKFRIPKCYLLSGVHTESDTWVRSFQGTENYSLSILSFDFIVRFSTFEPVEDRLTAMKSTVPGTFYKTFLTGHISHERFVEGPRFVEDNFQGFMDDEMRWGPYTLTGVKHGLQHYQIVDASRRGRHSVDEIFVNEARSTIVKCGTTKMVVQPFLSYSTCTHDYSIPSLHVDVSLTYDKTHLSRWRETERGVEALTRSFIIP